jgi:hypothetical protein
MNKNAFLLVLFVLALSVISVAQDKEGAQGPTDYGFLPDPIYVPSIAQQIKDGTFIAADDVIKEGRPKMMGANMTVPGKGLPKGDDPVMQDHNNTLKHNGREPILVFDANSSNVTPSDPTGAAGPNHFVGGWNMAYRVFDKEGNPLMPSASLSTLFPGNNLGDPIILYDAEADRFIITEFDNSPNGFNVAVCEGPDPVNDGWYIYTTGFTTGQFPDYTKFSIWSDAYYVTANINAANKVFAIERNEMLLGNSSQFVSFPLTGISTSGFYSPQFFNVTNAELPPEGNAQVVYLQDDAWSGVSEDHLKLWTVNVDWDDIGASTISAPEQIITEPFISVFDGGSFSNVPQPGGPDQDVLQATIMNQAQYRRFPTHNSAVFNFVVDTDGSGAELAGIRWYELRQDNDGDPWYIYQEGTYTSPYNNKHAFSGSMAMDNQGNIGMGYTTCSSSERIAIQYTGRYADDDLGVMTVDETLIAQSTGNNPSNRLADYVHLTVDPTDDQTFWHIAEYFKGGRTDVVGVFKISVSIMQDIGLQGITSPTTGTLGEEEEISINLYNYGLDTLYNIPVNYMIDSGSVVSEIFSGPIATGESVSYTFAQTANLGELGQSYTITSYTSMTTDENLLNDTVVKTVTNIAANDIGVSSILQPQSGTGLSDDETVKVIIANYGSQSQTNFDVTFDLDGYTHTEQVAGPLIYPFSLAYTFNETVDLSALGSYNLSVYTSLPDDFDTSNDTLTRIIENTLCQPFSDCSEGKGIYVLELGTIINASDCSPEGYSDFTEQITEIENNSTNDLTVTTHFGDMYFNVWIDFNDNFLFEEDEIVVTNQIVAEGLGAGDYTEVLSLVVPDGAILGEHIMRVKTNWNDSVPVNACEGSAFGETEDYMVKVVMHLGIDDPTFMDEELIIRTLTDNHFEIILETDKTSEILVFNLHDIFGNTLVENKVVNNDGRYVYHLDMSYAKPGAYIVRLGNYKFGKVKKIIVN